MQPQSPSPNQPYGFIFDEGQKPKKSLLPNMPGAVLILVASIVLIILIIIVSSVFLGKSKASTAGLADVVGQAQEINRVNTLEQPLLKDPNTLDLLVTSQVALTSEQNELNSYAKSHKINLDANKIASYKNSQTDASLQTAVQNNNLDAAYAAYLKKALNDYSDSLVKAYQGTKQVDLRATLKGAYNSTQTLLGNPPKST